MAYTFRHGDRPLDGLTVQRAVGRGGFGEVYYATTDSGKEVALKYLRENPDVELRGVAQVMNLKSPHLITVYDVRKNGDGDPFVLMEYISGPSLHELMGASAPGALGIQKAAFFLRGIAAGISYLHSRGIVHRDLKPGNIFYDEGYVKIGDYGLSKHISVSRHSGNTVSVGTVHYMAPEIGSGSYTKAIDIYALGVILYEMITGRLPFSGSSMGEVLMRHLSDRPDTTGIPEPFAGVIARALAKDPAQRFQDVNEMVDAVMSAEDVSVSVSTFDPASLASSPRALRPADPEATRTYSPAGVRPQPMDARVAAHQAGLPPIPPIPPLPWERTAERGAPRMDPAGLAGAARQAAVAIATSSRTWTESIRRNWMLILTLSGVALAVSLGISLLTRFEPEILFGNWFLLGGATIAVLVTHFKIVPHLPQENTILHRVVYGGVGLAMMGPGIGVLSSYREQWGMTAVPLVLAVAVCDWGKRIRTAQSGPVKLGSAMGPAALGLVLGGMFARPSIGGAAVMLGAALCGTVAFLVSSAAGIWPRTGQNLPPLPDAQTRRRRATSISEWLADTGDTPVSPPRSTADARPTDEFKGIVATMAIGPASVEMVAGVVGEGGGPGASSVAPARFARPIGPAWRGFWAVLLVLAIAGSIGFFVALANSHPSDAVGFLFGGLAGISVAPFLVSKMIQRHSQPFWRSWLRMAIVSAMLLLVSGMIALLAHEPMNGQETGGAVFGLIAGALLALLCLANPGARLPVAGEVPAPRAVPAVEAESRDWATPSFARRTGSPLLALAGKALMVLGLLSVASITYERSRGDFESRVLRTEDGRLTVTRSERTVGSRRVSPQIAIACAAVGIGLMTLARRSEGRAHRIRGFVGGLAAVAALAMVLGPAAGGAVMLARGNLSEATTPMHLPALAAAGGLLLFATLFLLWPKRRFRSEIVI